MQLYKTFEQATEAIEKLRLQLYPDLFNPSATEDVPGDGATSIDNSKNILEPITEVETETGEITEDGTSEAVGESDDEVRGRNDDDQNDETDNDEDPESESIQVVTDVAVEIDEHEPTQEDLEFEMAFEKMTSDSYQERIREAVKPSGKIQDIPVPMMAKSGKKTYDQLHVSTYNIFGI